jgi:hypothetical protein
MAEQGSAAKGQSVTPGWSVFLIACIARRYAHVLVWDALHGELPIPQSRNLMNRSDFGGFLLWFAYFHGLCSLL